jgi:uncharacterized protein (AIM24 family)
VSTYTAHDAPGELTLAPAAPGDIAPLGLTGEAYNIAASSYLASDATLEVDTGWGGAKSFFASDSLARRAAATGCRVADPELKVEIEVVAVRPAAKG